MHICHGHELEGSRVVGVAPNSKLLPSPGLEMLATRAHLKRTVPRSKVARALATSAKEGAHPSRLEGVLHSRKEPLARGKAAVAVVGLLTLGMLPAFVLSCQAPMTQGAIPKPGRPRREDT